jgi:hypothetical protein
MPSRLEVAGERLPVNLLVDVRRRLVCGRLGTSYGYNQDCGSDFVSTFA